MKINSSSPLIQPHSIFNTQKRDEFYEGIESQYGSKILERVLRHLHPQDIEDVTTTSANSISLYCHLFEIEQQLRDSTGSDQRIQRLVKKYLRYMNEDAVHQLHQQNLTHQEIEKSKQTCQKLMRMIPRLIEKYDEWICHRALNHFSIFPSDLLLGKQSLPSFETLCEKIDLVFKKEMALRARLEAMPFEDVKEQYEDLLAEINSLQDPHAVKELTQELLIHSGNHHRFTPLVEKGHIQAHSQLFQASLKGTQWADQFEELTPLDNDIHKNINKVYFLKDPQSPETNLAVFKTPDRGDPYSGKMETLAYDAALIFGLAEALAPTKEKSLKGMRGSIQTFQTSTIDRSLFLEKTSAEQAEIFDKIPMKSFLRAALTGLLFGNRDMHLENFFIVQKSPEEYSIVVFDNEFCFQDSNLTITLSKNETFLPIRCALVLMPHGDTIIEGETKLWLQNLVATWPQKLELFKTYLESCAGKDKFQYLSDAALIAFRERLEKILIYTQQEQGYTLRDLIEHIYPLYSDFYKLTHLVYPSYTDAYIGGQSAEKLHSKVAAKRERGEKRLNIFMESLLMRKNYSSLTKSPTKQNTVDESSPLSKKSDSERSSQENHLSPEEQIEENEHLIKTMLEEVALRKSTKEETEESVLVFLARDVIDRKAKEAKATQYLTRILEHVPHKKKREPKPFENRVENQEPSK